jgi:hypothetical protein
MRLRWLGLVSTLIPTLLFAQSTAQTERGPYARIAVLRPLDGHTVEFEAGYIRHLAWHQQAKETWAWYGWTIWAGDRQRWFIYATFGHSAASLDSPVALAEDERDNVLNVAPHVEYMGNALYEYLPALSHGAGDFGEPQPTARLEFVTVDLLPGAAKAFEVALSAVQSTLQGDTLWYRMIAGGATPRYVRLRPRPSVSAILDGKNEQALPDEVNHLVAKTTIEILTLRPAMSLGIRSNQ